MRKRKVQLRLGIVFAGGYDLSGTNTERSLQLDEGGMLAGLKRWHRPVIEYFYGYYGFDNKNKPDILNLTYWVENGEGSVVVYGSDFGVDIETCIERLDDTDTKVQQDGNWFRKCTLEQIENEIKRYCLGKLNIEIEFV